MADRTSFRSLTASPPAAEDAVLPEPVPPETTDTPDPAPEPSPAPEPTPEPVPLPTDRERLAAYLEAERAILLGHQSYTVDGHTFTRADLGQIQAAVARLRRSVALGESVVPTVGGIRTTQVVF